MISDLKMTHCLNPCVIMMLLQKTSTKTFLFKEYFDLSYVRNIAMRISIFTFTLISISRYEFLTCSSIYLFYY